MRRRSDLETKPALRSWRFLFCDILVRMWDLYALLRLIFPVPVTLNRLAAPRCVLSFCFAMCLNVAVRGLVGPGRFELPTSTVSM